MLREVDKPQGSRDLTTVDQEILRAAIDPEGQFWIGVGLPVVLGAAILEGLVLTLRRRYDWRAFLSTWGDVAGRQAIGVLGYYWYHRAAHRVRRFWATHSVHHSPNEPTLAASLRMGWTGKLTGTALFFVPLMWLGFSTVVSVGNKADVSGNDLLQYWEEDRDTDVILLYLESFGNPRRFAPIAPPRAGARRWCRPCGP